MNFQARIGSSIIESLNSILVNKASNNIQFYSWDNEMMKFWLGIRIPIIGSMISKMKVNRKDIRWCCPFPSLIKLNFDGASRRNLGSSRVGFFL